MFRDLLAASIPKEVSASKAENVVVFTDAGCEREADVWPCGLGGVVCVGSSVSFFSLPVSPGLRKFLGTCEELDYFEVETLAAVLAAFLWKDLFANRRVLLFVDNEGTKFFLIEGHVRK